MIRSFRHRGLERFFVRGVITGVNPQHRRRLRLILARLHAATSPKDMDLPGLRLHELKGPRKGTWAVNVTGNWRLTFRFDGVDASDVNYEDYH